MKTTLFWVGVFLVFFFSCQGKTESDLQNGKQIVLRIEPSVDNPRNSEGDFIRLKDGRILFVYTHFTGGRGDDSRAHLSGRFSSDGGQTWTQTDRLILPNEGKLNTMSVSLLRLHSGKIALFYLRKNSDTDCVPMMRPSTDEAKTWGKPVQCVREPGYYVMNNDRAVQLKSGRLLLPLALHNTPQTWHFSRIGRIFVAYSDDEGHTWRLSREVPNPDKIVLQEPGVVALRDGRLMLFCRTTAGSQYLSFSRDHGKTWSPVAPSAIRSPCSPASIERIPATGDLLLVWNNTYHPEDANGGPRTPLTLAISRDEGKTWEKMKTLESDPHGWYCYTAIEWVGNHALLAYCAGNRLKNIGLETTQVTRLSLDWIYADATPEPFVAKDSAGVVVLQCPLKRAEIHYTLDGSVPDRVSPIYKAPIHVQRSTLLAMRAFFPKRTPSGLVTVRVGTDILQDARRVSGPLAHGLSFTCYEGTCSNTWDIDRLSSIHSGVIPQFSLTGCPRDSNFALTFAGYIEVPKDGVYTFSILSNDGSVLFLDDFLLINNDGLHGNHEVSGTVGLRAGKHRIVLKYFQLGGGKTLKVFWQELSFQKQEIPARVLFHKRSGR